VSITYPVGQIESDSFRQVTQYLELDCNPLSEEARLPFLTKIEELLADPEES
jgi:hypothetical protein